MTTSQIAPDTNQKTLGLWNDTNRCEIGRDLAIIPGDFDRYKQQVVMSITLPNDYATESVNVISLLHNFCKAFLAIDADIELHPFDQTSTDNPVKDIDKLPTDKAEIEKIFHSLTVDKNRAIKKYQLHAVFIFSAKEKIQSIKQNQAFWIYLKQNGIFIKPTLLRTSNHVNNGMFKCKHFSFTNQRRMEKLLREGFSVILKIFT